MNVDYETPNTSSSEPFPEIPGVYLEDNEGQASWSVVVEHLSAKEKERCEIWKDEVSNILIFAGLFSAVVTAFIVDTCQSLQNNTPNSDILLLRIASSLELVVNKITGAPAIPPESTIMPFTPSSPSKIVNALWFMSLILSLASALIGLVALQWLREHLRPSTRNVPLRTLPAIIQMQAESLEAYYVPQIFTALPVLLILAIVLFFIGMIEFLWNINHTVAYPSVFIISLILAFILYTTLCPGLQGPPHIGTSGTSESYDPKNNPNSLPTVACPYRSPQSWAFLQATIFVSEALSSIYHRIPLPGFNMSKGLHAPIAMRDWIDWAISWPRQRDIDYNRATGDQHSLLRPLCNPKLVFPPVYDTTKALTRTKKDFSLTGNRNWEVSMKQVNFAFKDLLAFHRGSQGFYDRLVDYVHTALEQQLLPLSLPQDQLSLAQATPQIKLIHSCCSVTVRCKHLK